MMFGFEDQFEYIECSECGCLQIMQLPADLSKYYPAEYYSFSTLKEHGALKRFFKRRRAAYALGKGNFIGRLAAGRYGIPPMVNWIKRAGVDLNDPVLDVGCGNGALLLEMSASGFSNLTGVDPYIERDLHYKSGVRVLKRTLQELDDSWDLIMLHHSFEHVLQPLQTLRDIHRILNHGRYALIRIPVAGSEVWRMYGADWVQLDAPRHLFLHTRKSVEIMAVEVGFAVSDIVYDSTAFQFWGSEQYRRGIPLRDNRSYAVDPQRSIFTQADIRAFEADARSLNEKEKGDQACFYLRKI